VSNQRRKGKGDAAGTFDRKIGVVEVILFAGSRGDD
jgi:hypothetical protein